MESRYIKSMIGEIAKGIEALINQEVIDRDKKVILFGLDRYSFAMRTILSNLGFNNIEGYISDDEAAVIQHRMEMKNFACRYLSGERDLIPVWTLQERLQPFDEYAIILLAAKEHEAEKSKLESMGYQEGRHYFTVYNFQEDELDGFLNKMTRMTLDEAKAEEKEILAYVDKFCQDYQIRYWVCGGTLLGTIRHKGFIPWDDDIDIFMPWQDYLKFIELFGETQRYGIIGFDAKGNNRMPNPFIKVVNKQTAMDVDTQTIREISYLFIDVFPLIGMPEEADKRRRFFMEYQELNRQIWQDFYAANGNLNVFPKWAERQRDYLERYDFDTSAYVGVLGTVYGEKDCTHRNVYDKVMRMPFEDIEVNVAAGYKEYLDNLYGTDWMKLPDEDKRISHHNIQFYRSDGVNSGRGNR